jgi:hypothetical protein
VSFIMPCPISNYKMILANADKPSSPVFEEIYATAIKSCGKI